MCTLIWPKIAKITYLQAQDAKQHIVDKNISQWIYTGVPWYFDTLVCLGNKTFEKQWYTKGGVLYET